MSSSLPARFFNRCHSMASAAPVLCLLSHCLSDVQVAKLKILSWKSVATYGLWVPTFIDDFPVKTSVYRNVQLPVAMFHCWRVTCVGWATWSKWRWFLGPAWPSFRVNVWTVATPHPNLELYGTVERSRHVKTRCYQVRTKLITR